jgi:hypothetical protein
MLNAKSPVDRPSQRIAELGEVKANLMQPAGFNRY